MPLQLLLVAVNNSCQLVIAQWTQAFIAVSSLLDAHSFYLQLQIYELQMQDKYS